MGRKVTDGLSVDVTAPAGQLIEDKELIRIDGWSGFAADEITATEVDRALALDISEAIYSVKVAAAQAGTRGNYLYWTAGAGLKRSATDLLDAVAGVPIAKVETPRNAQGYARVRLAGTAN
jgi:hypothetical protein